MSKFYFFKVKTVELPDWMARSGHSLLRSRSNQTPICDPKKLFLVGPEFRLKIWMPLSLAGSISLI